MDIDGLVHWLEYQDELFMPRGLAQALYDAGYRLPLLDTDHCIKAFEDLLTPVLFTEAEGEEQSFLIAGLLAGAGVINDT